MVAAVTQQVTPHPQPIGPLLQSSHSLPQHPFPIPPVKRMTKDLSYAGSKNQNFLLAFSFVASYNSLLLLLPIPAPGWKPSLHLSYCFKPKFTVSVGGQDPFSPPLLHPTLRTLGLSRGWGPTHLPFALTQPRRRKEGSGGKRWATLSPHIPSGSGHVSPSPNPGLLPGGYPDPFLGPSPPSCWECGFQQKSWKKSETPQTPYGGIPTQGQGLGVLDAFDTPGQSLLLRILLGLFPKKPPHTPLHKPPLPRGRGPSAPSPVYSPPVFRLTSTEILNVLYTPGPVCVTRWGRGRGERLLWGAGGRRCQRDRGGSCRGAFCGT